MDLGAPVIQLRLACANNGGPLHEVDRISRILNPSRSLFECENERRGAYSARAPRLVRVDFDYSRGLRAS